MMKRSSFRRDAEPVLETCATGKGAASHLFWEGPACRATSEMVRLALKKFPASNVADEFPIPCSNLAADGDDVRPPFDLESFERIVIQIHLMSFGGNFSAIIL